MKSLFLSAILALSPIAAAAESYECTTESYGSGGWVSNVMILGVDREKNVGSAFDFAIQEVHKAPIPVKFKKWSDNRFQFNWTVKGIQTSNSGSSIISYKVTLRPNSGKFTLSGRLHGSDNVISGSGTCEMIK
ncbi:hypothetical protein [Sulfitobacter sp.]|uniref:hypothetical protein n=1 Tax=Sulfitobacter sp. TaxID=1903071 RepID=UPI0030033622